jgi:magnesium-transporting ATPase (P-type)
MQILAVDLGTDLLPALALGAEAPEPDVMRRPPRSRRERLLNLPTLLRAYGWLGMIEAALSLGGFFFAYWLTGWRRGEPMERGDTEYGRP